MSKCNLASVAQEEAVAHYFSSIILSKKGEIYVDHYQINRSQRAGADRL